MPPVKYRLYRLSSHNDRAPQKLFKRKTIAAQLRFELRHVRATF